MGSQRVHSELIMVHMVFFYTPKVFCVLVCVGVELNGRKRIYVCAFLRKHEVTCIIVVLLTQF